MRAVPYPERVVFRDNAAVIASLKAKAVSEGLTFAEVMRRAVRREMQEAA